jgi:hypothetical protein
MRAIAAALLGLCLVGPGCEGTDPADIQVTVAPHEVTLAAGATTEFVAAVAGTDDKRVTWSVPEPEGGSISAQGLYTAPGHAGSYHVVATSLADPLTSDQASVTVTSGADPCQGVACSGHGACVEDGGVASCQCDAGYHAQGLACLADADPCAGVTCSGHGACVLAGGAASCDCDPGYSAQGLDCVAAGDWQALSVTAEQPGGYDSDVYRWLDSGKQLRTAVLTHNESQDPGGSYGGMLRQFRFFLPGGTERVVTGTGSNGWNGWGYLVNHVDGGAVTSNDLPGSHRRAFVGRHHAIHEFTWTLSIYGTDVLATVHWFMATGRDHPIYAITYDTSAAGASGFAAGDTADSRSPYGDLEWDGDGNDADVSGVGWGDKYRFFTRDEPESFSSRWDYSQPNVVPYVHMWVRDPDAEMGSVQTQSWLQHNTGGTWLSNNWGHTSEDRVGTDFTELMPADWNWPYQLNQYELPFTAKSKRLAWGLMYGAVGQAQYDGYGYESQHSGHPYQSYALYVVLGRQSAGEVMAQVAQVELALGAQFAVSAGQVTTQGPGGAGRSDSVTYPVPGYNHTYGAFELQAAGGAFRATLDVPGGALRNPIFLVHGVGAVPATVTLDGAPLTADSGYFASLDTANQVLWLTIRTEWSGSHTLAAGD